MYKRILVPIDGSTAADAGVREAIKLASGHPGSTIRLLHVLEPLPALHGMDVIISGALLKNMTAFGEKILKNARALVEQNGISAETVFQRRSQKRAADGIEREAKRWKADVIVMGTNGQRGLSREVLGSDSEMVASAATVPVVLVRTPTLPFGRAPRRRGK